MKRPSPRFGMVSYFPATDHYVGAFLAFASQVWFTQHDTGHRLPGYAEGPLAEGTVPPIPPPTSETLPVWIIAALVNPEDEDVGQETVILFNASTVFGTHPCPCLARHGHGHLDFRIMPTTTTQLQDWRG